MPQKRTLETVMRKYTGEYWRPKVETLREIQGCEDEWAYNIVQTIVTQANALSYGKAVDEDGNILDRSPEIDELISRYKWLENFDGTFAVTPHPSEFAPLIEYVWGIGFKDNPFEGPRRWQEHYNRLNTTCGYTIPQFNQALLRLLKYKTQFPSWSSPTVGDYHKAMFAWKDAAEIGHTFKEFINGLFEALEQHTLGRFTRVYEVLGGLSRGEDGVIYDVIRQIAKASGTQLSTENVVEYLDIAEVILGCHEGSSNSIARELALARTEAYITLRERQFSLADMKPLLHGAKLSYLTQLRDIVIAVNEYYVDKMNTTLIFKYAGKAVETPRETDVFISNLRIYNYSLTHDFGQGDLPDMHDLYDLYHNQPTAETFIDCMVRVYRHDTTLYNAFVSALRQDRDSHFFGYHIAMDNLLAVLDAGYTIKPNDPELAASVAQKVIEPGGNIRKIDPKKGVREITVYIGGLTPPPRK